VGGERRLELVGPAERGEGSIGQGDRGTWAWSPARSSEKSD
jgi:hypothetical protein